MLNQKSHSIPAVVLLALALAAPAAAVQTHKSATELDPLMRSEPGMFSDRQVAAFDQVASTNLANPAAWTSYLPTLGPVREVYLDLATGEPAMVKGAPVPMIPGAGNGLALADVSARLGRAVGEVDAAVVGDLVDRYLDDTYDLIGVPRGELVRRGVEPVSATVWVVTYEHRPNGIPAVGSRVTFVIGHGNLILWGSEYVFPHHASAGEAAPLSAAQAQTALESYVGWDAKRDRLEAGPELVYLPARRGAGALAAGVRGRDHRLVYEMIFRRDGVMGTWLAHVDAATGAIVQFGDINRYDWVRGGTYPMSWADEEENRPMPLVALSSGGFSTVEGNYTNPGATVTGSLDGERTEIADQCPPSPGFPSVDSDGSGNINFGTGPANPTGEADCATNGIGGPHNTHSARAAYYHITRTKKKGTDWLPANSWLAGSHEVRVNIEDTCNAYWSPGGGFNGFFQSGFNSAIPANCTNTGELAAIFLHEVGHGIDQNDAQGTADGGTGETYADVLAMLELHDSCMGDGFWDMQCTGYGFPCTDCSGVRDQDYAKHVDGGGSPVTTPFTPANFTSSCPGGFFGTGPCGQEVHCEAYPAGGALWDLAVRKLAPLVDAENAWYRVERDWMLAMQLSTAMFNCNSTTFASDGCAATSWFQTMLAIDDDDGDLTNGTPRAAQIFEAFDDHAVACGTSSDPENQNSSACPALATPSLAATPNASDIALDWDNVTNATGYLVLKNHGDCSQSYLHQAVVPAPVDGGVGVGYTDTDVLDNQTYGYRVAALADSGGGADNACYSELSNCVTPAITQCPGAISAAPGLSAPADNRVDVAWNDAGTCAGFNLYRKQGGCAAAGEFEQIAPAVGSSPYMDLTVSGGITYGYEIGALDPSGSFEAGRSPCSEIAATGVCNLTPTYDATGLTATNDETAVCGISLAWNSGTTACPAQSVVYNVYRDTTPGFTPGAGNRIASGVATTAYADNDVDFGTEYFYIVRAEALTGVGPGPNGGVEDTNTFEASSSPSGPFAELFTDDIEGGTGNWTVENAAGSNPWATVTTASNSPTTSWFVPDIADVEDQRLATVDPVAVTSPNSLLHFWHRVQTEANWDGGVLEYSTDGGSTWFDILEGDGGSVPANPDRFLQGAYTGPLNTGTGTNPINGRDAWHGAQGTSFSQVEVDLVDFSGESVHFRWRFGSDGSVGATGWWVDDIEVVEGSMCSGDPIFIDGFESGDTTAWSVTVP